MEQDSRNNRLDVGRKGETIAAKYLENKGFTIIARNYRKKWGEIDIVARETSKIIHFVEVKSVSYETRAKLEAASKQNTWRPEENVHPFKLRKLNRAIESWLMENRYEGEWCIDVIAVKMVLDLKYATVKYIPNVIL